MKPIILILTFFISIELNAQTNTTGNTSLYRSELSIGVGTVYDSYGEKVLPFSDLNINIHSYKILFFDIGTHFNISGNSGKSLFRFALYASPNLQFNLFKNQVLLFTGAGLYLYKPFVNFGDNAGVLIFLRGEYKISKYFSAGLDIKNAFFVKGDNDETVHFTLGGFYLAYRF